MIFRTIIKRAGLNPLTGRKQYQVWNCFLDCEGAVKFDKKLAVIENFLVGKLMIIKTPKRYQPNCFINPRKALGI